MKTLAEIACLFSLKPLKPQMVFCKEKLFAERI